MTRKIAIFSDIHGNAEALKVIISDIKNRKIRTIYCLGDVIGIGPSPRECLDIVIDNSINMILGNHELYYLKGTNIDNNMEESEREHHRWISEQLNNKHREFLNNCSLKIVKKIGIYNISFEHFILNNKVYPFEDLNIINSGEIIKKVESDITFIGHEHKAFEINENSKKLIDVGSSGCTKDNNTFYTLLTIDNDNVQIEKINLKYNRNEFERKFKNISYPDKEIIGKIFFEIND